MFRTDAPKSTVIMSSLRLVIVVVAVMVVVIVIGALGPKSVRFIVPGMSVRV